MNESDVLSVLIIGCGNIAGDLDSRKRSIETPPLTHAGAFTRDKRFHIKACVDISEVKSKKFAAYWNIPNAYRCIKQAAQSGDVYDVISICTPTACHYEDVLACLPLRPKLIFCEKPVTESVQTSLRLKAACERAGVLLAVNYLRRWDDCIISLKREIETNQRGSLRSVVGYYNKGILNNGSHLLDLLGFLIGEMEVKHIGQADYDFFSSDPSVCVSLEGKFGVPIVLVPAAKARDYSIFEIQMAFDNSMLLMMDGGLRWIERNTADSLIFEGYRVLDAGVHNQGGYLMAMANAVENIWGALSKGERLNSSVDTALIAHALCEDIIAGCKH